MQGALDNGLYLENGLLLTWREDRPARFRYTSMVRNLLEFQGGIEEKLGTTPARMTSYAKTLGPRTNRERLVTMDWQLMRKSVDWKKLVSRCVSI